MLSNVITRAANTSDADSISKLHDKAFGPGRFARAAYRVREGTEDITPFCRVAYAGETLVAAIRLTEITIGGEGGALLLGPLAVDPNLVGLGIGRRLVAEALEGARAAGKQLVVLVGDEPYYGRFGFKPVPPGQILFPGPVDLRRVLAAELAPGSLMRYRGLIKAKY
jgi:predicted N-acetyltransferase YhbS